MANDINRVYLIGRLTKDPDLRYTQGGTSIASFTVANNRTYTAQNERKEQVSFFNCIAWGKPGEVIAQYVKKGQRIALEGRLQQRSWDDQEGRKRQTVEVVVDNFQFLTPRDNSADSHGDNHTMGRHEPAPQQQQQQQAPAAPDMENPFSDDDIPF